ncbi:MAG: hypothetical protein LH614_11695 [Pyrinomonadaceae bacterium]|nr:hypothetical protein [Pyrinomonadaceae bacterium]
MNQSSQLIKRLSCRTNSMDGRARQRLYYLTFPYIFTLTLAVSPPVISAVGLLFVLARAKKCFKNFELLFPVLSH